MCKGSTTTTSSNSPPPQVLAAYQQVMDRASGVAAQPYVPYTGQLTAGQSPDQANGQNFVGQAWSAAAPFIGQGTDYLNAGAANVAAGSGAVNPEQFSGSAVARFMDPYQGAVINATQGQIAHNNAIQATNLTTNGIKAGNAFGGDRLGVAQAELARNQDIAGNQTIANLYSQGYGQALGEFNQQQGVNLGAGQANMTRLQNAGSALGSLGRASANMGQNYGNLVLNEGNALSGIGATEQATDQARLTALYNQFQQQQSFPYAQTSWLSGIQSGLGGLSGGSSSTTAPPPNPLNSIIGGIGAGASLLALSDERAKHDVREVGETHDGQPIYTFKYKGQPGVHMGLMAQEVEGEHPEAVHDIGGMKHVDYHAATRDAEVRRADGGGVAERVARFFTGDRDHAHADRAFYNATRAGLWNSETAPEHGSSYGGIGHDLETRRRLNAGDALSISDAVPRAMGGGVAAFAGGGGIPMPYGGVSYINVGDITKGKGSGIPNAPTPPKDPVPDYKGMAASINKAVDKWGQQPHTGETSAEAGASSGMMGGVSFPMIQDQTAAGGVGAIGGLYRRGGAVRRAAGGRTVAGLGMGARVRAYASGGGADFGAGLVEEDARAYGRELLRERMAAENGANVIPANVPMPRSRPDAAGPRPDVDEDGKPYTMDLRASAHDNPDFMSRGVTPEVAAAARTAGVDLPVDRGDDGVAAISRAAGVPAGGGAPSNVLAFDRTGRGAPGGVGAVSRETSGLADAGTQYERPATVPPGVSQEVAEHARSIIPHLSDNAKTALLTASLALMASRSSNFGAAVGDAGLAGVGAYGAAQKADREAADAAQKLSFEQHRLGNEDARLAIAQREAQRTELLSPWIPDGKGGLKPRPGGSADPEYVKSLAEAKAKEDGQKVVPLGAAVVGPDGKVRYENKAISTMDEPTANLLAERVLAGDSRALIGLGKGAQGAENILKIQSIVAAKAAERGIDARGILTNIAEQAGQMSSERALGTRRVAFGTAEKAMEESIPIALEASRNVPRTSYPALNKLIQAGETNIGDPKLKRFLIATDTAAKDYARTINPTGVLRESDILYARKVLSTADSPEAYEAALDQLHTEAGVMKRALQRQQDELRNRGKTGKAPDVKPDDHPKSSASSDTKPTIKTKAEYDSLPSNTEFIGADGKPYRKP